MVRPFCEPDHRCGQLDREYLAPDGRTAKAKVAHVENDNAEEAAFRDLEAVAEEIERERDQPSGSADSKS